MWVNPQGRPGCERGTHSETNDSRRHCKGEQQIPRRMLAASFPRNDNGVGWGRPGLQDRGNGQRPNARKASVGHPKSKSESRRTSQRREALRYTTRPWRQPTLRAFFNLRCRSSAGAKEGAPEGTAKAKSRFLVGCSPHPSLGMTMFGLCTAGCEGVVEVAEVTKKGYGGGGGGGRCCL
jgi:hypothetical protein